MAAIANIVINDGQGTPVANTFAPAKTQADYALLEERSAGIYIGYKKLTMKLTRPQGDSKAATRNLKLSIKVETPKLETVSNGTISGIAPAPTISYRPVVELTATFPERSNLQDRKDLQAFLKNALSNAFVTDAFEKYELPY
jgi:hypothetical protein